MKAKLTITIEKDLIDKTRILAEQEERSLSKMIELMLKYCFEHYSEQFSSLHYYEIEDILNKRR
jgi:hypothetical protein